jgi:hypothetical protein
VNQHAQNPDEQNSTICGSYSRISLYPKRLKLSLPENWRSNRARNLRRAAQNSTESKNRRAFLLLVWNRTARLRG